MPIKLQTGPTAATDVLSIKYGAIDVDRIMRDGQVLWTRALMNDSFNRPNSVGLGANWNDEGTSASPYIVSVVDGAARLNILDGLVGLNLRTSTARWTPHTTNGDDGYIEARVASRGSTAATMETIAWRRVSNTGFTAGVGIKFTPAGLRIVRRVGSVNTDMANCGTFSDGDTVRMTQMGNVHTLFRNGTDVGVWNDSGATAQRNASHRSMAITASGDKPFLGPRRFSTSLDYIECR